MIKAKEIFKKLKTLYKQEEFSKAMIIVIVMLTALIAAISVGDSKNISLAFWIGKKESVNRLPQTGTEDQLDPRFRACIWNQNTVKSCEPSFLAGLFNNTITIADAIEIVPIVDFDLGAGAPGGGTDGGNDDNSWNFDDASDENWGRGGSNAEPDQWFAEGNNADGSRIMFDGSDENPFAPDSVGEVTQTMEEFTVASSDKVTFYINAVTDVNSANIHLKMRLGTGSWFYEGEGTEEHGALESNEQPPYGNYVEIDTTGNEWIKVELPVDQQAVGKKAGPVTVKVTASGARLRYILMDDAAWGGSSSSGTPLSDDEITERVNDPNVKWKALLYGIGGIDYFRGLESTGNTNVPGTQAFDFANGGVWGNRMEYSSRVDLAKKFPGPFQLAMTSKVTTADGNSTSEDINLTLLVDKLGSHLGSLYVDDTEFAQGFNYTDNSPLVGIPAQFISKTGYSSQNDPGVTVDIPSETTPDTYFETWQEFYDYLTSLISSGVQNLRIYSAGDCAELDDAGGQYQSESLKIGNLIEEHPEDTLPNKEYLTNAGEVYSYDNNEMLCEEYLETGDDPFVTGGIQKEDFFDIAYKPKCEQCQYDPLTNSGFGNIVCDNEGIGRRLADVPELRNEYGMPDPDYEEYYYDRYGDDFACKLDNVIEGTFVRDYNDDGSVDVLLQDNGKPIPDKSLQYWNEETRPGPNGEVRPWCWLKYTKNTSLSKQAKIDMTIKGAEIPAAAGSIFHVLRKMTSKLPNPEENQICLSQDIGTVVRSKLGILNTRQCGYFREVTGNRVTAYYTLEELIAKGDLPFNQGGTAQMCSPEKRIEPACDGKASPVVGAYAPTSIPESPVQGSGYAYVYYTFPFMGNIPALEQAFSKMLENIKANQTTEEQLNYIENLLPTFNARLCEPGEMNIAVKWLINLGYITEEDAVRLNLYHKGTTPPT